MCTREPFDKKLSKYYQQKMKKGFKRRAAIEPKSSHLKSDYRLVEIFIKDSSDITLRL
jgi:hypothetical protein